MAVELLSQSGKCHSDQAASKCSLLNNARNTPREVNDLKDTQIPNLITNHPGSHGPVAADKPTTSLPTDKGAYNKSQVPVPATINSPQHANNGSIATDSVTRPYGSPNESSVTSECGSDSSVKIPTYKSDLM